MCKLKLILNMISQLFKLMLIKKFRKITTVIKLKTFNVQ